jgi:hypothetical protein
MRKVNGHIRLAMLCVSLVMAFAVSSCELFFSPTTPTDFLVGANSKTWVATTVTDDFGDDVLKKYASVKFRFDRNNNNVSQIITETASSTPSRAAGTWTLGSQTITLEFGSTPSEYKLDELTNSALRFSSGRARFVFKPE